MSDRKSINVPGYSHGKQPIPAASRVGNVVMTGGISGIDPATGTLPDDAAAQAALMFSNLERILAAAGASMDRIVKMTVWVKVPEARVALNDQWLRAFPEEAHRPARHTLQYEHLPANMLIQCDACAVVDSQR